MSAKRFLNVDYSGTATRINVAGMEDLSEVQDAIKSKYGPAMNHIGAPQIELYDDKHDTLITDIPDDYFKKPRNGGLCLVVKVKLPSPPPSREPSSAELEGTSTTDASLNTEPV